MEESLDRLYTLYYYNESDILKNHYKELKIDTYRIQPMSLKVKVNGL